MRVTTSTSYMMMRNSLANSEERVAQLQQQLSSGLQISKMSDDPAGAARALAYRAEEADQDAFGASADNADRWLGLADSQLQGMSTALRSVNDLAVQAGNGSLTPEARQALSQQVQALRDEVVSLANTKQEGRAIFGGFSDTAISGTSGSWSFGGDNGQVLRRVGQGVTVQVNVDGKALLGFDQPAGKDVLSVIDALAAHITSGDQAAIANDQTDLESRAVSVRNALGTVGAATNRVDAAKTRSASYTDELTKERSSIESVDYAQAIMQLSSAQLGYQAALGVAAKSNLPSLADFLR